jgi:hypothetical protein
MHRAVRTAPAGAYSATTHHTSSVKPPLPHFQPHHDPPIASSRYSIQLSTPEATSHRDEHPHAYSRTQAASYHDAVKFSGGRRSSNGPAASVDASAEFHHALYQSGGELGSLKGLDCTHTSHGCDTRMDSVCRCGPLLLSICWLLQS